MRPVIVAALVLGCVSAAAAQAAPSPAEYPSGKFSGLMFGDYYAYEYFQALAGRGYGGEAVRASVYHYNTADEVAALLAALDKAG